MRLSNWCWGRNAPTFLHKNTDMKERYDSTIKLFNILKQDTFYLEFCFRKYEEGFTTRDFAKVKFYKKLLVSLFETLDKCEDKQSMLRVINLFND